MRPDALTGRAASLNITVDEQDIVALPVNSKTVLHLPPGQHALSATGVMRDGTLGWLLAPVALVTGTGEERYFEIEFGAPWGVLFVPLAGANREPTALILTEHSRDQYLVESAGCDEVPASRANESPRSD
jgi:hypothetical protein